MVSKRTQQLVQADKEHHVHPFWPVGSEVETVFEKGHGIYLVDTEGKEYIDFSSQLVCSNLGHHCQEVIDAITAALHNLDYATSFFGNTNVYAVELSQKLAEITPGGLRYFYYTCGGSESVDTALKFARGYWNLKGQSGKYKIISLYESYHGLAGNSINATGAGGDFYQAPFGPALSPGYLKVPSYNSYRSMFGDAPDSAELSARFMEQVIINEGASSIAAVIAEPIFGTAGGHVEPPAEWWAMVSDICKKHNVLLIVDEVMSGFCRTGKMFASEHWDLKPDIMTMAKGITSAAIPFGGVAFSDEIYSAFEGKLLTHGFTYTAHPVSCAAAIATIDYYLDNKVADNAERVGQHIKQRLESEFLSMQWVSQVGGPGLFQAIELVTDKRAKTPISPWQGAFLRKELLKNGVWTRFGGAKGNRMDICPPCTITVEEADHALDIIKAVLTDFNPSEI